MVKKLLATAVAVVAFIALVPASPAMAAGRARITKVSFDSPGPDRHTKHSLNAEWVRVKNTTHHRISMTGWRLHDRGRKHTFHFPRFHLTAGAHVKIHTGPGRNTKHNLHWDLHNYVWNNTGDKAYLNNKHAHRVDTCKWGSKGRVKRC
ncbi:MAG: lamin tail domain-containing protein [Nocardioidaceae bacterium]